jgi:hypothetical protein
MASTEQRRSDPSDGKSGASPSGAGMKPKGEAAIAPDSRSAIEKRAYELASNRGFEPGREIEDWLQAEREVEAGPPRSTPPDNPFDVVKTRSNQ